MATNRIIKFSIEADAWRLRGQSDLSEVQIAEKLTELSGEKITRATVNRYFKDNKDPIIARIAQREEVVQQAVAERLDTVKQLRDINSKTQEILDAMKEGDPAIALKAIERIEKQLELQAKLLGDIPSEPIINITIVQNQFNEFKALILEVLCPDCRAQLARKLHEIVGK